MNLFNDTGYRISNIRIWLGIRDHRSRVPLLHDLSSFAFLEELTFYVFTSQDYYTIDFRIEKWGPDWEIHDVELPLEGSPLNITIRHEYFVFE